VSEARRQRLDHLTARWRARHEARVAAEGRPPADPEREARADASFPWRTQSAAEYAETHGAAMAGYTFDAYSYADPALEAWLRELGALLRERGRGR
jgi:hypothetical protein